MSISQLKSPLFFPLAALLALAWLALACRPVAPQTPTPEPPVAPARTELPTPTVGPEERPFLFQQEILHDRRGETMNDILVNHTALVVNPTASPLQVEITVQVPAERATLFEFETAFTVMTHLMPPGYPVPDDSKLQLLSPPAKEVAENGDTTLSWEASMGPGEGVIAFYNCHFLDPEEIYAGDTVVLPFAKVGATATLTTDELELQYTIENTAAVPLREPMFAVFLPAEVTTSLDEEPVSLYEIEEYETTPAVEVVEESLAVDGFLNMAIGNDFFLRVPRLDPGGSETLTIRCQIARSGAKGEVVPYLSLQFDCAGSVVEPFAVDVVSPSGMGVDTLPPVYISNVGFPDVLSLSF